MTSLQMPSLPRNHLFQHCCLRPLWTVLLVRSKSRTTMTILHCLKNWIWIILPTKLKVILIYCKHCALYLLVFVCRYFVEQRSGSGSFNIHLNRAVTRRSYIIASIFKYTIRCKPHLSVPIVISRGVFYSICTLIHTYLGIHLQVDIFYSGMFIFLMGQCVFSLCYIGSMTMQNLILSMKHLFTKYILYTMDETILHWLLIKMVRFWFLESLLKLVSHSTEAWNKFTEFCYLGICFLYNLSIKNASNFVVRFVVNHLRMVSSVAPQVKVYLNRVWNAKWQFFLLG